MRHISRTPAAALLALAALALTGCSAGTAFSGADEPARTEQYAPLAEDGGASTESAGAIDRALVITGTVTITADDPIAASERATAIALDAGGRVDSRTEHAPRGGDAGSATLVLRIPASAVEQVRDALKELGRVDETALDSVDVGTQQRDLETRITTLRASIARYTAWLADADTTSDLIELESAISSRQTELESLEAQQRDLADRVAMSTITLQLRSEALAPSTAPADFGEAVAVGWNAFVGFWAAVLVAVGVALPWLVVLALAGVAILWIVRRATRTGRAATGSTAAPSAPPAPPAP